MSFQQDGSSELVEPFRRCAFFRRRFQEQADIFAELSDETVDCPRTTLLINRLIFSMLSSAAISRFQPLERAQRLFRLRLDIRAQTSWEWDADQSCRE